MSVPAWLRRAAHRKPPEPDPAVLASVCHDRSFREGFIAGIDFMEGRRSLPPELLSWTTETYDHGKPASD